jgi:SSS family solute:Na+ symporter
VRPNASAAEESQVAKLVSLGVKFGALACILVVPQHYAIELQLLGGVWILQTFPAIAIGLFGGWMHHRAVLAGWAVGIGLGMVMVSRGHFAALYPLPIGDHVVPIYIALAALVANLIVASALTPVFDALRIPRRTAEVPRIEAALS